MRIFKTFPAVAGDILLTAVCGQVSETYAESAETEEDMKPFQFFCPSFDSKVRAPIDNRSSNLFHPRILFPRFISAPQSAGHNPQKI